VNAGAEPLIEHRPDDPDDLLYNVPTRPSELAGLSDAQLFRLLRKVAFANEWRFDTKVQFEAASRLIAALKDFKDAADRAARFVIGLTIVLVILTAVLVWLTTRLA
jgi:hypothetical protein